MSTALRSVGLLDVLSSTPAEPSGRAPWFHARLRRLATKPGEKCGLGSCQGIKPGCPKGQKIVAGGKRAARSPREKRVRDQAPEGATENSSRFATETNANEILVVGSITVQSAISRGDRPVARPGQTKDPANEIKNPPNRLFGVAPAMAMISGRPAVAPLMTN